MEHRVRIAKLSRYIGHLDGQFFCMGCGSTWASGAINRWWPVRCLLANHWHWGKHGYQIGWQHIEQRVFNQVISIGPIRIILGPRDRLPNITIVEDEELWIAALEVDRYVRNL